MLEGGKFVLEKSFDFITFEGYGEERLAGYDEWKANAKPVWP